MDQDLEDAIKALKLDGECLLIKRGAFDDRNVSAIAKLLEKPVVLVDDFDDIRLLKAEVVKLPDNA